VAVKLRSYPRSRALFLEVEVVSSAREDGYHDKKSVGSARGASISGCFKLGSGLYENAPTPGMEHEAMISRSSRRCKESMSLQELFTVVERAMVIYQRYVICPRCFGPHKLPTDR
jgi:hypothetical protein